TPTPTPTAPKPEGTLVWGASELAQETFVPWMSTTTNALAYLQVYDYPVFVNYQKGGEFVPMVFERWEFSEDYRDFTVWLREGIPWHDGWGEITADDVKYTYDLMLTVGAPLRSSWGTLSKIFDSIEVIDPYTVVFHFTEPNTTIYQPLICDNWDSPILCKKYVEAVGEDEANLHPLGSGPYRLLEHMFGDYLKYEAYDEHWRVVPEFKYLVKHLIPEESTRVAMLKTGEIDATELSPMSVAELPKEGFNISPWGGGPTFSIMFGGLVGTGDPHYVEGYHNTDPWADEKVREAMNIAIDRQAICDALYAGLANPIPLYDPYPGMDLPPIPYDPERAKQLLAEAGYPNGFTFDLINSPTQPGVPLSSKMGEAAAGYWEEVGLSVNVIAMEVLHFWIGNVKTFEHAGALYGMRHTYIREPLKYVPNYTYRASTSYYQDDTSDRLGEALMAEMDFEKRLPLWKEFGQYIYDMDATVPFVKLSRTIVSDSKKVGDWPEDWSTFYYNLEYVRHAEPLNTFRLFDPMK
ncbi:ABC transporter substrate-binding protein, partial [Chloroflexota bacterium]